MAEESGGYRIFRSTNDGETFVLLDGGEDTLELVGCGTNRFYARYGNGEKVYSDDGVNWKNAENINASNWSVFNASGVDYISCSTYDEDLSNGLLEKKKFILIKNQMKFDHDGRVFEKLCINDRGDIVCISGMDGKSLLIGRTFRNGDDYGDIEYIEYPYVGGMVFSGAHVVDEDIVLSPYGGMTAVRITGAYNRSSKTEIKFIDISTALNNEINVFGGFGDANDRILMYPSDGNAILVYDKVNSKFHRLYSFDSAMTLSGALTKFTPNALSTAPRLSPGRSLNFVLMISARSSPAKSEFANSRLCGRSISFASSMSSRRVSLSGPSIETSSAP